MIIHNYNVDKMDCNGDHDDNVYNVDDCLELYDRS